MDRFGVKLTVGNPSALDHQVDRLFDGLVLIGWRSIEADAVNGKQFLNFHNGFPFFFLSVMRSSNNMEFRLDSDFFLLNS